MNPPFDAFPGISIPQQYQAVSPDASVGVARSWGSVDGGHPQMNNLWRINAPDDPLGTVSFDLLSAPIGVSVTPEQPPGVSAGNDFVAGSEDYAFVAFGSSHKLIGDAPDELPFFQDGRYLYMSGPGGGLRLVNVLPDGSFASGSVVGYASPTAIPKYFPGDFAVSANGSRVFFSTTQSPSDQARELYVSEVDAGGVSGSVSTQVSESERTDCAGDPTCGGDMIADPAPDLDAPPAALFQAASAAGNGPAVFASPRKLSDEATASTDGGIGASGGPTRCAFARCGLYRWDPSADEGHRLEDLTASAAGGGGVLGTIGVSRDLSRVFFVAIGVLATGGVDGQPNVYVWQQGQPIRYIATLDGQGGGGPAGDEGVWGRQIVVGNTTGDHNFGGGARVSPDGRFLVFRSHLRLTGYDNAGHYQLYRYDTQDQSLVCISCNPNATASTASAYLKQESARITSMPWVSRNVSADGDVVFDTDEGLVRSDVNGLSDVYEWSGSKVRLVSSGAGASGSRLLDASATGLDVFFTTRDQLVDDDQDNLVDLYDARIGGGTPEPLVQSECQGDTCQGVPSVAPVLVQPGAPADGSVANAKPPGHQTKARPRNVVDGGGRIAPR